MPDASAAPGNTLPGIVERPVSLGAPDTGDPATLVGTPSGGSAVAAEHVRRRRPRRLVLLSSALIVLIAAVLGWILIGGGADTVTVPNVDGKSQSVATTRLEADGFTVKVRKVNVADAKAGEVVGQTPKAGTEADKASVVTLSVATGNVRIPVDDLVGATYDDAVAVLDKLGLKGVARFAPSDKAAGTVIAVDPTSTAKIGSTVTLTVANGSAAQTPKDNKGDNKKNDKKDKGSGGKDKGKASDPTPSPSPSPSESPSTDAPE
jgi:serine/threonine-protein kinase